MARNIITPCLTATLVAMLAVPVAAQPPGSAEGLSVVTSMGTVTLERPPSALTMTVQLMGNGKDVQQALANLKDRREAAELVLESLKADMDSVKFTDPSTSNTVSAQRAQFEAMVRTRIMSSGRSRPKGLEVPKSVTVSTTLSARWPLEGKNTEELLVEAGALAEQIKAADIAGIKEKPAVSPEEQELLEEMAAGMSGMGGMGMGGEELPPGVPQIAYVGSITAEEADTALAEAFQKARRAAARLAAAAGGELGPLARLASNENPMSPYNMYEYGYPMNRAMLAQQMALAVGGDSNESLSPQFGPVKFRFSVNAGFYLKPGAQP